MTHSKLDTTGAVAACPKRSRRFVTVAALFLTGAFAAAAYTTIARCYPRHAPQSAVRTPPAIEPATDQTAPLQGLANMQLNLNFDFNGLGDRRIPDLSGLQRMGDLKLSNTLRGRDDESPTPDGDDRIRAGFLSMPDMRLPEIPDFKVMGPSFDRAFAPLRPLNVPDFRTGIHKKDAITGNEENESAPPPLSEPAHEASVTAVPAGEASGNPAPAVNAASAHDGS